jgi:hypothetical protein
MEVSARKLRRAVEFQHGGTAKLVTKLRVKDVFEGKTVWDGVVYIFDLEGNSKTTRAYAWSSPGEGKNPKRRFFAVLHLDSVRSPLDAVRAAIVEEHRNANRNLTARRAKP